MFLNAKHSVMFNVACCLDITIRITSFAPLQWLQCSLFSSALPQTTRTTSVIICKSPQNTPHVKVAWLLLSHVNVEATLEYYHLIHSVKVDPSIILWNCIAWILKSFLWIAVSVVVSCCTVWFCFAAAVEHLVFHFMWELLSPLWPSIYSTGSSF